MSYITELTIPPPSRADSTNFSARADIMMTELPIMVVETNVVIDELNALHDQMADMGAAAVWTSGASYEIGDLRISTINLQIYSRITNGAGVVDPSLDPVNWAVIKKTKISAISYEHQVDFPVIASGAVVLNLANGMSFVYDGASPHYFRFYNLPAIAVDPTKQTGTIFEIVVNNADSDSFDIESAVVETPSGYTVRPRTIDNYGEVSGTTRIIGVVSDPGFLDLKLVKGNW